MNFVKSFFPKRLTEPADVDNPVSECASLLFVSRVLARLALVLAANVVAAANRLDLVEDASGEAIACAAIEANRWQEVAFRQHAGSRRLQAHHGRVRAAECCRRRRGRRRFAVDALDYLHATPVVLLGHVLGLRGLLGRLDLGLAKQCDDEQVDRQDDQCANRARVHLTTTPINQSNRCIHKTC